LPEILSCVSVKRELEYEPQEAQIDHKALDVQIDELLIESRNAPKRAPINKLDTYAEEVTLLGAHERRPDLVLYVNGLALGVIELKRSAVSIGDGIRQLISNQAPEFNAWFFSTVQIVFAGNDTEGLRYGTIGTPEKMFLSWKEDEGDDSRYKLDKYLLKMCEKGRFVELMRDFVLFDGGAKKLPRVHELKGRPTQAAGELFVFVDECHRTQTGRLHKTMRALLPGAVFIGFTGTPLLRKDRQTSFEVFGGYIHTYQFGEAVDDGTVLDLVYEARDIPQELGSHERIDQWFEAKTRGLNDWQKAALREQWGTMQKVLSSRSRMERVVEDIVFDFTVKPRLASQR
jgi:type I site-specific restriction-modification system R (restriction) subunit